MIIFFENEIVYNELLGLVHSNGFVVKAPCLDLWFAQLLVFAGLGPEKIPEEGGIRSISCKSLFAVVLGGRKLLRSKRTHALLEGNRTHIQRIT